MRSPRRSRVAARLSRMGERSPVLRDMPAQRHAHAGPGNRAAALGGELDRGIKRGRCRTNLGGNELGVISRPSRASRRARANG